MLPAAVRGIVPANHMLQAHSPLWHYLWVAPNVLLLLLVAILWRRGVFRSQPTFLWYAIGTAVVELVDYATDISPAVSSESWWLIFKIGAIIEGLLKFILIGAIFGQLVSDYSSIAALGRFLIRAAGVTLILAGALIAALAPQDSLFAFVKNAHLMQQSVFLVVTGILLFIFWFAGYFRLKFPRLDFWIALGLTLSACVHLATWGIAVNAGLPDDKRTMLDFINMGTFQVCVVLWFYYLLAPHRVSTKPVPIPKEELAVWNRELERLLQR